MNTNKIIHFLKKQWILLWLISAALALTAVASFAEYKNENNVIKRVFVPAAQPTDLFSSNYLTINGGSRAAYFDKNASSPFPAEVIIRNYNASDPSTVFDGTINYKLTATLVHANGTAYDSGNDDMSAWNDTESPMSITLSYNNTTLELKGNTLSQDTSLLDSPPTLSLTKAVTTANPNGTDSHKWDVSFNNIPLDSDYCVKIEAVSLTAGVSTISTILRVAANPDVRSEGWTGLFSDAQKDADGNAVSVNTYDAFNYTIIGTGERWLYFNYDPAKFVVNPAFASLDDNITEKTAYYGNAASGRDEWCSIEIHADPDTTKVNRYDFQIYKVNSYTPASFTELENYVELASYATQKIGP